MHCTSGKLPDGSRGGGPTRADAGFTRRREWQRRSVRTGGEAAARGFPERSAMGTMCRHEPTILGDPRARCDGRSWRPKGGDFGGASGGWWPDRDRIALVSTRFRFCVIGLRTPFRGKRARGGREGSTEETMEDDLAFAAHAIGDPGGRRRSFGELAVRLMWDRSIGDDVEIHIGDEMAARNDRHLVLRGTARRLPAICSSRSSLSAAGSRSTIPAAVASRSGDCVTSMRPPKWWEPWFMVTAIRPALSRGRDQHHRTASPRRGASA